MNRGKTTCVLLILFIRLWYYIMSTLPQIDFDNEINEIKELSKKNCFNLTLNSIKIKNLENDAKQAAIFIQEMEIKMNQRDEQWRTFCQQQESKFREFVSSIVDTKK